MEEILLPLESTFHTPIVVGILVFPKLSCSVSQRTNVVGNFEVFPELDSPRMCDLTGCLRGIYWFPEDGNFLHTGTDFPQKSTENSNISSHLNNLFTTQTQQQSQGMKASI